MKNNRGFEKISFEQFVFDFLGKVKQDTSEDELESLLVTYKELPLPKRATRGSAGYDVFSPWTFELKPGEEVKIPTGFKSYMGDNEVLMFHVRSGHGFKYIRLANSTGIVDSDYYNNENNEGHCWIKLRNEGSTTLNINFGDGIAQCVFLEYLIADGDSLSDGNTREGGFGSTTKQYRQI